MPGNLTSVPPVICTRLQLRNIFDVGDSAITKWMKRGMPQVSRGKFDVADCVQWRLEDIARLSAEGEERYPMDERRNLLVAQTEKYKAETDRLRGRTIAVEEVESVLRLLGGLFSGSLDSLGGRLAGELHGLDNPAAIQDVLVRETRRIRALIADEIRKFIDTPRALAQQLDDVGGNSPAPAESVPRRVGRPKSDTPSRKRRARSVEK